ncbi:MAG TPA: hypothetical protein VGO76_02710 [Luteibacter sp.]|jgi:hypothetical protein|nr:hypothetical protein [Luteibacter sp.]
MAPLVTTKPLIVKNACRQHAPTLFQAHLSPDLATIYYTNKPPGIWTIPLSPLLAH